MAQTRARGSARSSERFSTVTPNTIPRSSFDRSHSHKTTLDSANLVPIYIEEVLPGDTWHLRPAFFARMATPLKPFMDGVHLDYQFFFTPLRLLWDNFVRMMGERPDPADHNDYTIPQMVPPPGGHVVGSLSDYLTLPVMIDGNFTHSSLFHRNYNLIFREWYRDENLVDPPIVDMDDGPDLSTDYPLLKRGKRKDYLTGSLPFAQKGDPVELPLGTTAPVVATTANDPEFISGVSGPYPLTRNAASPGITSVDILVDSGDAGGVDKDLIWGTTGLETDLSNASGSTLNEMRTAIAIQHVLEIDARGGTRYVEHNLAHFGVVSDDIRHHRPQLLATGSVPVQVSPVVDQTGVNDNLGSLAAFATAAIVGRGFMDSFKEHGIIMGIVSIRAELTYQRGVNRMFTRLTRYDHAFPSFAHLGEQAVESREIYVDGTGDIAAKTGDYSTWGFQPRFEEYRHRQSIITGEFRSIFPSSLDVWHVSQDFLSRPVLNEAFIEENPPIARVVVLDIGPEFLLDSFYKVKAVRPLPKYGKPGMTRF